MDLRMNNRVRNINQKSRPDAGFSLIEILVVLAILVIGVLGIIRIFPYGFLAIQRTAEQTNASALANQQLEYQKNAVSVPESIVAMGTNGAINPNILPDSLNPELINLADPNDIKSDVNKIRYVMGETFRIPTAFGSPDSTTNVNFGAVYTAQYGPIYYNAGATAATPDSQNPQVTGTPLQRVEQSSVDDNGGVTVPNLTSAAEYAIDYDKMMIAFYPRAGTLNRTFQFNYTYYTTPVNGIPGVQTIVSGTNKIVVPDITPQPSDPLFVPTWVPVFDAVNNIMPTIDPALGIRRGSEEVSRAFNLVTATPFAGAANGPKWTNDPYEYALYSGNAAGNANVGVFLFNPIGHNETIATPTGTQPFTARLSYQIYDNHIIRDQRSIPSVAPFDVRLSLPYISTTGDVQLDQTSFAGLFGNNTSNLLIYNANSGELITKGSGDCLPGATQPNAGAVGGDDNFTVDAKTGVVHFSDAFITTNHLQNVTLRIYYHTQKNFGQQLQKASAHYYPATIPNALAYNNYFVGDGTTGKVGRIYFAKSEEGKSVTVGSINYVDPDGNLHHTSGETYQISSNANLFGPIGLPYIDITTKHDDFVGLPDPVKTGAMAVDNIQGISMKSRVIWLRSVQTTNANPPVSTYHWRKLDNDTILTPNPTH